MITSKKAPGYFVQVNEKGQPVVDQNGAQKLIVVDENGRIAKVTPDGELKVAISGEINVGDITLDGVTIKDADGNRAKINPDGSQLMQVTGSKGILAGEPKPAGKQDETLLEYNVATKETKVYKYISGDWREL